jgi:hypothetical protein
MTGRTETAEIFEFSSGVYGVKKKDVAFLWKRMGMDLSHESTKNFDPLLIVRDPYTQEQEPEKEELP